MWLRARPRPVARRLGSTRAGGWAGTRPGPPGPPCEEVGRECAHGPPRAPLPADWAPPALADGREHARALQDDQLQLLRLRRNAGREAQRGVPAVGTAAGAPR